MWTRQNINVIDGKADWSHSWIEYWEKHRIPETADEFMNPIIPIC